MSIHRRAIHLAVATAVAALGGAGVATAAPGSHHTASSHADPAQPMGLAAHTKTAGAHGRDANTNNISYWQNYLRGRGYTDVACAKLEPQGMSQWQVQGAYALVVVNAAHQDLAYVTPQNGAQLDSTRNKKGILQGISHVIQCTGIAPTPATNPGATAVPEESMPPATPPATDASTSATRTTGAPTTSTPAPTGAPTDGAAGAGTSTSSTPRPSQPLGTFTPEPAPTPGAESTTAPTGAGRTSAVAVETVAGRPSALPQTGVNVLLGAVMALALIGGGLGVIALTRRR